MFDDNDSQLGRPSKFDESNLKLMKFMYEKGYTDKQVASEIGVTYQTINNWKKKYLSFFDSLKDWKLIADEQVEKSLYQRATGYSIEEEKLFLDSKLGSVIKEKTIKHYPPDATSMIFWLKNRQPELYREKIDHAISKAVIQVKIDKEDEKL